MESKHIGSPIFVSRNRVQDLSFLKEKVVGEGGGLSKQSDWSKKSLSLFRCLF